MLSCSIPFNSSDTEYFCRLFTWFADFFQNLLFEEKIFRNFHQISNSLTPDQDQRSVTVSPDLGPNCCIGYQQMMKVMGPLARKELNVDVSNLSLYVTNVFVFLEFK